MVPSGPPRDILIDTAQQWARLAEEQDRATDLRKKNRPPQLAASSIGRVSAASNAELGLMGTQFSEVACLLLREWDPIPRATIILLPQKIEGRKAAFLLRTANA